MTQVLVRGTEERERTEYRIPVRRRGPVAGYTLMAVGLLALIVGAYFQFAPSNWWLADFSEVYHLGSYTVGGLLMGAGLGLVARHVYVEDARPSARMITVTVLAVAAVGGAIAAGVALLPSPTDAADLAAAAAGSDRHLATQADAAQQAQLERLTDAAAGSDRHLATQAQAVEDAAR